MIESFLPELQKRRFFEEWQPHLQTSVEFLPEDKSVTMATDLKQMDDAELSVLQKRLVNSEDFPIEAFTEIGFSHHIEILRNTKELDERLFISVNVHRDIGAGDC